MLDLFQILAAADCKGIGPVVALIRNGVFPIIQIGIPILLILMGTIDLGKAVMSNDDKEIKGATSKLIKRAIMAVAVFFVTTIVTLVMNWLSATVIGQDANEISPGNAWANCWKDPLGSGSTADEE